MRKYLSVTQAARLLEMSKRAVRSMCESGKLPASKRGGGKWYISMRGLQRNSDLIGVDAYFDVVEFASQRHTE